MASEMSDTNSLQSPPLKEEGAGVDMMDAAVLAAAEEAAHDDDDEQDPDDEDEDDEADDDGGGGDEELDDAAVTSMAMAAAAAAEMAANFDPNMKNENDGETEESGLPSAKRRRTSTKRSARPWNDFLFELLKYRSEHGNVMVPFKSGGDLGKWVASQRAQYLALQKSLNQDVAMAIASGSGGEDSKQWHVAASEGPERLTEDRMRILSSIGFVWDVVQADNDARWKKRFEELKEYKSVHGHCNVPQSTDLGKWVKMQRENKHEADLKKSGAAPARKKPKPCLSLDRIEKLESIGFQWRVAKPAVGWENRYQQLLQYRSQHGDCNVPQSYPPDKPFGRWVMKQRCQHSLKLRGEKSQLTDERESQLNAIGFSWVAPGFSKKTVTMPGDEEEQEAVRTQAQEHAAQQAAAAAAAEAAAQVAQEHAAAVQAVDTMAVQHHMPALNHHVHAEEYPASWNV